MMTLRIRGLYAAALTALFRQYGQQWAIVQPDEEIRSRLSEEWRMDTPDVEIDDHPAARGVRDAIRMTGAGHAVREALQLIQRHCPDVIVLQSNSLAGAIYMGLVGLVSPARRRAIIYLGDQLAGILPLNFEDRELRLGSYVPVRIEALTSEGDERLQLSASLTVPGHYAVLTLTPVVRISKQITDPEARERLQRLGSAQETSGWGIIWRTAAQEVEDHVLQEEIQRLIQEAQELRKDVEAATTVGYLHGGEMTMQVFLPAQAQMACDSLRAEILPTLPGHHKYKAKGDVYGAIVDALEKELPADVLRTRTATLSVLSSLDAMQAPFRETLSVQSRQLDGSLRNEGEGERLNYDLSAGWVEMRQELRNKDSYPDGLQLDKQPGDYTIIRFQEGSWSYVRRFYGRDGTWKGDVARVTTPVALFSDQVRLVNLLVTVTYSPQQEPQVTGLEELQALQQRGVVSMALVEKTQAESTALLQHCQQERAAAGA